MAWGQAEGSGHGLLAVPGGLAGVPKPRVFVVVSQVTAFLPSTIPSHLRSSGTIRLLQQLNP